jgi:hypothetical protein
MGGFVLKCKEFLAHFVWKFSKTFLFSWVLQVVIVDLLFPLPGEFYTPISSNSQTVPQVRSKEICEAMCGGCTYPFVQFLDLHTQRQRVGGGTGLHGHRKSISMFLVNSYSLPQNLSPFSLVQFFWSQKFHVSQRGFLSMRNLKQPMEKLIHGTS